MIEGFIDKSVNLTPTTKYTIMPNGKYYNPTSLQFYIDIKNLTNRGGLVLNLNIGWMIFKIYDYTVDSVSSFHNSYYILPFLSNGQSHIIFQQPTTNRTTNNNLPCSIDLYAANEPFCITANQNTSFTLSSYYYFT